LHMCLTTSNHSLSISVTTEEVRSGRVEIVLTTISTIYKNQAEFADIKWDLLIIDEGISPLRCEPHHLVCEPEHCFITFVLY
jgi:hypothetical protein